MFRPTSLGLSLVLLGCAPSPTPNAADLPPSAPSAAPSATTTPAPPPAPSSAQAPPTSACPRLTLPRLPGSLRVIAEATGGKPSHLVSVGSTLLWRKGSTLASLTPEGAVDRPDLAAGLPKNSRVIDIFGELPKHLYAYVAAEDSEGTTWGLYKFQGSTWRLQEKTRDELQPIGVYQRGTDTWGLVHVLEGPENWTAAVWRLEGKAKNWPVFAPMGTGPDPEQVRNEPIASLAFPSGHLFVTGVEPRASEPHLGILELWSPDGAASRILPIPHAAGQRAWPDAIAGSGPDRVLVGARIAPARTSDFQGLSLSRWDGSTLTEVPSPAPGYQLAEAVAATSDGALYALGRTPGSSQEAHARVLFRMDKQGAFAALPLSETCEPKQAHYELASRGTDLYVLESLTTPEGVAERVLVLSDGAAVKKP